MARYIALVCACILASVHFAHGALSPGVELEERSSLISESITVHREVLRGLVSARAIVVRECERRLLTGEEIEETFMHPAVAREKSFAVLLACETNDGTRRVLLNTLVLAWFFTSS